MTSSWLWPFSSSAASRRSEAGGKKRKGGWENKGGERKRGKSGVLAQMCEIKVGYYGPGRNTPQRPRSRPGTTGENGNFSWLLLTLQRQVKKTKKNNTHKTKLKCFCTVKSFVTFWLQRGLVACFPHLQRAERMVCAQLETGKSEVREFMSQSTLYLCGSLKLTHSNKLMAHNCPVFMVLCEFTAAHLYEIFKDTFTTLN